MHASYPFWHLSWWLLRLTILIVGLATNHCADAQEGDSRRAESARLFEARVLPVLEEHCFACHSARAVPLQGGLQLDTPGGLRAGGDSGPVVVAGDVPASRLVSALRHEDLQMPPDQDPLPATVIADVVRWIELGAADNRPETTTSHAVPRRQTLADAKDYWAFRPLQVTPPPPVENVEWPSSWIDRYILAKLESEGLQPAPPATPQVWVRRVYYTLTGLPPDPEVVAEFVADPTPRAAERLVDRLLASPAYAEHAAQQWLDLVRFAESEGFEYDNPIPDAWRYRDYVIESLERDVPFDQFLREQLAGDELDSTDVRHLTASTFHRLGAVRRNAGNQQVAASRNEVLTERTDIIGAAFLGLSIGCARCHDHKFDAISQRDYYQLQAFLASTEDVDIPVDGAGQIVADADAISLKGEPKARQNAEQKAAAPKPPSPVIPAVRSVDANRTPIHILVRGEWDRKRDPVSPRGMSLFGDERVSPWPAEVDHPRTKLADWLLSDAQSLVARVYVNRVWQSCFGQGLVASPNNFGIRGSSPSHPELLDRLAVEFIRGGWHRKTLVRSLVLSSTFRQSSAPWESSEARQLDPENQWLGRWSRRRLTAEELRDSLLEIAGNLNRQRGGASVMVPVEPQLVSLLYKPAQWSVAPDISQHHRRSIYLMSKRNLRLPFLEVFDQPSGQSSCPQRQSTTHAPQSLELLNGAFANEMAVTLAARLEREVPGDHCGQVQRAYWLTTGRAPTERELAISLEFLSEHSLSEFALATLNLNGLMYVE
ncbi:MAG: PSD1 and planctomycete cytochrome C domain-containing protein [Pirellulales bacterium]